MESSNALRQAMGVATERLARLLYPDTLWTLGSLVALLVVISILVRMRATLPFDLRATRFLQETDHPVWTRLALWSTFLGNSSTLIVLALLGLAASVPLGLAKAGIYLIWSLAALPINVGLKNVFDRERPGETEVRVRPGPRWGFSYPSGHSMGSAALYGWLAFVTALYVRDPVVRYSIVAVLGVLPVAVAVSRVYLGAHWLSDVVGGLAGGAILVIALASFFPV